MSKNVINSYFGFNKQQRNGLFFLVCLSFVLFLIRLTYPYFISPNPIVIKNLPLVKMQLDSNVANTETARKNQFEYKNKNTLLFNFDPNTVSYGELLQLGFSKKTAAIFIKYRQKGFQFKTKEDVKTVFGVSDRLYKNLAPYIVISSPNQIANNSTIVQEPHITKKIALPSTIDINTADSAELASLPGIGLAFASRILKYKELLGGYVSVQQLKEVYGFSEEMFLKLEKHVVVKPTGIRKINLNTDAFKTINKHPYLSYEHTKTIFEWRRKTNITPTNLKDILNDAALVEKLLPYLYFD